MAKAEVPPDVFLSSFRGAILAKAELPTIVSVSFSFCIEVDCREK